MNNFYWQKSWKGVVLGLCLAGMSLIAGEPNKGYLGVNIETVKNEDGTKVRVVKVLPDSAAEKAGLVPEDLIIKVNGVDVLSSSELIHEIVRHNAGEQVELMVFRDGEQKKLAATLEDKLAAVPQVVARRMAFVIPDKDRAYMGINMDKLGPQMAQYFKVDQGVLVESVAEGGPAEAAGMSAGDIIQSIDGEQVASPKQLSQVLSKYQPGDEMTVEFVRREKPLSLTFQLGKHEPRVQSYNYSFGGDDDVVFEFNGTAPHIELHELHEMEGNLQENLKVLEEHLHELKLGAPKSKKSEPAPNSDNSEPAPKSDTKEQ